MFVIPERSAVEAAQLIADALEQANLSYAIGGALALAVAGVPRGTADVDLNVFVPVGDVDQLFSVLQSLGITIDVEFAEAQTREKGMFIGHWDGMRIDVFLPSIPFAHEAERTRIQITDADGWTGWFLSSEALAIFKLLFFRGKDVVDLERLVAVSGESFDHAYVRRWMVEMMGDDDERITSWDDIVRRFAPS